MSWVLLAVIIILAECAFMGWRKGIIKIVVSLATVVITLLASTVIAPLAGEFIKNNTGIYSGLEKGVYTAIVKNEKVSSIIEDKLGADFRLPIEALNGGTADINKYAEVLKDNAAVISDAAQGMVEKLNLPENISIQLEKVISADSLGKLAPDTGLTAVTRLSDGTVTGIVAALIASKLAGIIFNAIVYVIVFALIFIILRVLVFVTDIIGKLPVIKQANKIGGLVLGVVEGLMFVWLLFTVITAFGSFQWASNALSDIAGNEFLSYLYDKNLILKLVFKQ